MKVGCLIKNEEPLKNLGSLLSHWRPSAQISMNQLEVALLYSWTDSWEQDTDMADAIKYQLGRCF